jgi:hypothetical protein
MPARMDLVNDSTGVKPPPTISLVTTDYLPALVPVKRGTSYTWCNGTLPTAGTSELLTAVSAVQALHTRGELQLCGSQRATCISRVKAVSHAD